MNDHHENRLWHRALILRKQDGEKAFHDKANAALNYVEGNFVNVIGITPDDLSSIGVEAYWHGQLSYMYSIRADDVPFVLEHEGVTILTAARDECIEYLELYEAHFGQRSAHHEVTLPPLILPDVINYS